MCENHRRRCDLTLLTVNCQWEIPLWSERENQQDATVRCLLSTLPQHVSGIIMPIFRRTRRVLLHVVYCAGSTNHIQQNQRSTPRLVLLKMGIMMPETCWESVKNKHLTVASCWFSLSVHNLLTMHGHRNLKLGNTTVIYVDTGTSLWNLKSIQIVHMCMYTLVDTSCVCIWNLGYLVTTGRFIGTWCCCRRVITSWPDDGESSFSLFHY